MTADAVARAALTLQRSIGLRAEGVSRQRLERAIAELGRGEPGRWLDSLQRNPADLQDLIDYVTVQETGFFREPQHFEALAMEIGRRPGPGTIWSAGCANGQEAWSLAMLLEELQRPDWRVVATDISSRALARAREGLYGEREAARLAAARRRRFLEPRPGGHQSVKKLLRERVTFTRHNLASPGAPPEAIGAQVVFCRNVLIYLDAEHVDALLRTLKSTMAADGLLFIGAAEVMPPGQNCFDAERRGEAFVFRPAAAAPATPDGAAAFDPIAAPRRASEPREEPSPRSAIAAGEVLAAAGLHAQAVAEFRRAAFLRPEDPVAHVRLALSLEQAGDPQAAMRAFRAARTALRRTGPPAESDLGGFSGQALQRLIERRLDEGS